MILLTKYFIRNKLNLKISFLTKNIILSSNKQNDGDFMKKENSLIYMILRILQFFLE